MLEEENTDIAQNMCRLKSQTEKLDEVSHIYHLHSFILFVLSLFCLILFTGLQKYFYVSEKSFIKSLKSHTLHPVMSLEAHYKFGNVKIWWLEINLCLRLAARSYITS